MWGTVALYWLAPKYLRLYLLALLSLLFLASVSWQSALLLSVFTLVSHIAGRSPVVTQKSLVLAVVFFVITLVGFKLGITNDSDTFLQTTLIPLGLSYYTFRCIHFLMERFSGRQPVCRFGELVAYLFFLPTIPVGPIHRIDDFLRDMKRQRFDTSMLSDGAERILYGYVKIVVLSNFLVERVFGEWIWELPSQDGALVSYLTIVKNGLNIYLQFSGHSDIAIGLARLLGFRIIENFNWPYLQANISAFWRSWHISLSGWCRDYIYEPVVSTTRNPVLGALATMIVIGLWHEISLRYLVWGAYHGMGIVAWQYWQGFKHHLPAFPDRFSPVTQIISVGLTVHFVWFGFEIINADSLQHAFETYVLILIWWV